MAFNRVFTFKNKKDTKNLEPTLAQGLCTYSFTCLWSKGTTLTLAVLMGRVKGDTQWHQIITNPITDIDGEITVQIGKFAKGSKIELAFDVFPLEDIPACALFTINNTENTHKKIAPASGNKPLEKGTGWKEVLVTDLG
jgi:hypothetical protein